MQFTLPQLDYSYDALEPFIDAKTMEIHHTKHHQTYVDKLNALVSANSNLQNKSLEELCADPITKNMAGGHYNHSLFWKMIGVPKNEKIPDVIAKFRDEFDQKALALFGSGWVWLAKEGNDIKVIQTPLQDAPINFGVTPILGIDLWEHAYYLKYQNRRAEYIEAFWKVVNMEEVLAKI